MPTIEPLHPDTLLRVYLLVTTMLALATLGGARHLKAERALWFWAAAFAAAALTQLARNLIVGLGAPQPLWSIGHLGGVLSALLVTLGLREYFERPLRATVPVAFALLLCFGSFTLTALTGALWPSLCMTLVGSALLTLPALWLSLQAWRERGGFPLALMTLDLLVSIAVEVGRALAVSPLVADSRAELMAYNAVGLLLTIALLIGQALAMLLLLQDRALSHIERLIEVDVLTGLLNRRGFDERLRRLTQRGGEQPPVLALLDVDHFKRVNDTHGHAVGDAVLSRIGERLRETLRPMDLAVRLGGEEFAVVWPTAEPGFEERLGERLREVIGHQPFMTAAGPLTVTVSIGVARARGPAEAPETLFSRADAALYVAKETGRNRVELAA